MGVRATHERDRGASGKLDVGDELAAAAHEIGIFPAPHTLADELGESFLHRADATTNGTRVAVCRTPDLPVDSKERLEELR